MASFRIDTLSQLSRQMAFTPNAARVHQLAAAEELLLNLDPNKAYPLDEIIHRITGYHPKYGHDELLAGEALQHDLGLLIENVSQTLGACAEAMPEPVLRIEDVCERFNVTSKTIQRWRRRGLPARRFVFPDGKRRVGFLLHCVDRFFATHRDEIPKDANFSLVGLPEQQQILSRARRLARESGCWPDEIARRIGRRLRRSPLTILHTVRKHDQEHPGDAIFTNAASSPTDAERTAVAQGHRNGLSLTTLARQLRRTRTAIYRMFLEERIAGLSRRTIRFIDDPLYHQSDASQTIDAIVAQESLGDPAQQAQNRVPRDLPAYLQELWRTPLLSAAQERGLFLKFNFHKFQFVTTRQQLDPLFARAADLSVLEGYLRAAVAVKNAIVQANLRLVVSIARKHLRPGLDLMELISDGNLTLMRAAESFDIHRGNRFSTYATLALMKGFARSVATMRSWRKTALAEEGFLSAVPDARLPQCEQRLSDCDEVNDLLSRLSDREQLVLRARYGLDDHIPSDTYLQLSQRMGLSKQRVRQIEQSAFAKLRATPQR